MSYTFLCSILGGAVFIALLFYAAFKDLKDRRIPNFVCVSICILAVTRVIFISDISPLSSFLGLFVCALPFLIFTLVKKGSIGGGDIKLLGSVGLFLGLCSSFLMLFVTLLLFLIVTIIRKQENKIVPFAPYVAVGAAAALTINFLEVFIYGF